MVTPYFFLVPSGLILASWNAVPGDALYGVKVNLENHWSSYSIVSTPKLFGSELHERRSLKQNTSSRRI